MTQIEELEQRIKQLEEKVSAEDASIRYIWGQLRKTMMTMFKIKYAYDKE